MNFLTFVIVLVGWIFSLCLHEFAHAFVAYQGGDYTVREKGYLTFNPLKYTHPVYSLLLPLLFLLMGGIGLPGGAVYIERWRLRGPRWESAVSLAGPMANALLALILGLALHFAPVTNSGIWPGLAFLGLLQVSAVVLNLIPVPPFDGYGIIEPYLPMNWRIQIANTSGMILMVVFLVLWFVPFVNSVFWGLVYLLAELLGIPLSLASLGLNQFMFLFRR
ncbi:MAG TPA: site-2 protease family protein [Anaerolineales bacterium]|nr:site-2 protease family protein [Anaerolineales bacterium]